MSLTDEIRLSLTSADLAAERLEALRDLFPEAFSEGKLDVERLTLALGDAIASGPERYGLSWAGKADAMRAVQVPSVGTLVPAPEESVNFDMSQNLFIEGDNLEVLKLLQKSYHGKVKMIYIDPPYNTGNDFIYPDNFREGLQDYLRYSGQVDANGFKTSTTSDTDGRIHSKWLSMMYPRLFLARNLLREDGTVLVSCNDKEQAQLKLVLSDIFGEENYVATLIWNNEGNVDNQSKVKTNHEYIHMYARDLEQFPKPSVIDPNIEEASKLYNDEIENSITKNGPANPQSEMLLPEDFPANFESGTIEARDDAFPHILDRIDVADSRLVTSARVKSGWSSRNLLQLFIDNGFTPILDQQGKESRFALTHTGAIYLYKQRSSKQGHVLTVVRNVGTTKQNSSMLERWGLEFDYPKPVMLARYLAKIASTTDEDIVLDFFAGSRTTAHAVLDLNREDGGNRRFVMVQLPEPTELRSVAHDAGYDTIADIGKERIRRVIAKLKQQSKQTLPPEYAKIARRPRLQGVQAHVEQFQDLGWRCRAA